MRGKEREITFQKMSSPTSDMEQEIINMTTQMEKLEASLDTETLDKMNFFIKVKHTRLNNTFRDDHACIRQISIHYRPNSSNMQWGECQLYGNCCVKPDDIVSADWRVHYFNKHTRHETTPMQYTHEVDDVIDGCTEMFNKIQEVFNFNLQIIRCIDEGRMIDFTDENEKPREVEKRDRKNIYVGYVGNEVERRLIEKMSRVSKTHNFIAHDLTTYLAKSERRMFPEAKEYFPYYYKMLLKN